MGREIRKVPKNWEHPKKENSDNYQPMNDENYKEAVKKYVEEFNLWESDKHPSQIEHKEKIQGGYKYEPDLDRKGSAEACERLNDPNYYMASAGCHYWEYSGNPPEEKYYHNYSEQDAIWFQVYETVSEGTPITPPFASLEELKNYLVNNGDFWGDKWSEKSADALIKYGGVMSGMITGGKFYRANEIGDIP